MSKERRVDLATFIHGAIAGKLFKAYALPDSLDKHWIVCNGYSIFNTL